MIKEYREVYEPEEEASLEVLGGRLDQIETNSKKFDYKKINKRISKAQDKQNDKDMLNLVDPSSFEKWNFKSKFNNKSNESLPKSAEEP